ncbi:MAG: DoxX family protein [Chitinophagaceae bacterium]
MKNKTIFHILKRVSLFLFCTLYVFAGINHFRHPEFYLDLIPPYFPNQHLLNIISGVCEIIAGVLMIIPFSRKISAYLIIALLIAFIPAHVYLIQMKGCVSKYICIAEWLAWVRLFPLQFILMWWSWKTYRWNRSDYPRVY